MNESSEIRRTQNREQVLFQTLERRAFVFSIILTIALVAIYVWVARRLLPEDKGWKDAWGSFTLTMVGNLAPLLVISVANYIFIKKIHDMKSEFERDSLLARVRAEVDLAVSAHDVHLGFYEDIRTIPWKRLIVGSSRIDVVVHFWPSWISDYQTEFLEFFKAGGHVRIVLPNPKNTELIRAVHGRLPDFSEQQIKDGIRDTIAALTKLKDAADNPLARVIPDCTDKMLWYCAVRFDERNLVLSFYEHERLRRVESPSCMIDLVRYTATKKWFEDEFNFLFDRYPDSACDETKADSSRTRK